MAFYPTEHMSFQQWDETSTKENLGEKKNHKILRPSQELVSRSGVSKCFL